MSDTGVWTHPPSALAEQSVDLSHPHLVGVGGHGMSALARVLGQDGARVSSSDHDPARLAAMARVKGKRGSTNELNSDG
ncbi:Mur ligase domain-containing protein [Embleya sp. NPDC005575]|uniref:Mur ligase domain-containing protein n=1 Tax=Embleya sp. NPDC005575 TaxID=3156892 RepID=UPI0033A28CB0